MSESIKITGEWRSMERLAPGIWLRRLKGAVDPNSVVVIANVCMARDDREYMGPLEIVEPEPEPTPLPGCRCDVNFHEHSGGMYYCKSIMTDNRWALITHGDTRRQAIIRHNAAVAAIIAMEGPQ